MSTRSPGDTAPEPGTVSSNQRRPEAATSEPDAAADSHLLEVSELCVNFTTRLGDHRALDAVSLHIDAGEIHGLVGESGAGKSTLGAAIIGLLPRPGRVRCGSIRLDGRDLVPLDDAARHALRGRRISMIFQDPQTSLNPLFTISDQLVETLRQHRDIDANEARRRAIELLQEVGLADAESRIDNYPHHFSGGMRQRVVIALALCTDPDLIIADEPTTALDVSVQKRILALIRRLANDRRVGVLLITHDIGVIGEIADRVTVLRHGQVLECGDTATVLGRPAHDYTRSLMAAVPRLDVRRPRFQQIEIKAETVGSDARNASKRASDWLLADGLRRERKSGAILEIDTLSVEFGDAGGWFGSSQAVRALDSVSLSVQHGEVLGLVGESGSGKSTLARAIVGLVNPSGGRLRFDGNTLPIGSKRARDHPARRRIQMIFQDPYSSLNNRKSIAAILEEPLAFHALACSRAARRELVRSMLSVVELPGDAMRRYPHQFSGGQRQRIAVARALLARPDFLICDEPTSALDVSIQAGVLNLLKDLQSNFGLSVLFISHDLPVVRQMADRVVVLRGGQHVETADNDSFFSAPSTDYGRQLLAETPSLDRLRQADIVSRTE